MFMYARLSTDGMVSCPSVLWMVLCISLTFALELLQMGVCLVLVNFGGNQPTLFCWFLASDFQKIENCYRFQSSEKGRIPPCIGVSNTQHLA
jgi:hypothetical protein